MFLSNEAKSPVLLALTLIRVYKHRSSRSTMGWARPADFWSIQFDFRSRHGSISCIHKVSISKVPLALIFSKYRS